MKEDDKNSKNKTNHDEETAFLRRFAVEIGEALRETEDASNDPNQRRKHQSTIEESVEYLFNHSSLMNRS
jgi:arsenate reductase-like glutaredoxin family protein